MTIYTVSTTAALLATLKNAKGSDVIQLAAGDYSGVTIKNMHISGNVTITSADLNHPAVITDMLVRGSSGITFANLDLKPKVGAPNNSLQVYGSTDIAFDNVHVEGPANLGSGAEQSAFMIRASSNVSVTNSEFSNLWHGLSILDNKGVTLSGNYFHDIRTDGIRGGGNSNVSISDNLFTDFYPAAGDHPDAIQLWTTNTSESASHISITDNIIVRGDGAAIQGIFLRDQVGTLPFHDVTITGNAVIGGMYNGIAVDGVDGGIIRDNMVVAMDGQPSWIRAQADTNLSVTGNTATGYMFTHDAAAREADNGLALAATDHGAQALAAWLPGHSEIHGVWGDTSTVMSVVGLNQPVRAATIAQIENPIVHIAGTDCADRLQADRSFESTVDGGAGNDVLTGSENAVSHLSGGSGDDTYILKSANDHVIELADGGYDTVAVAFDYTLTDNVEQMRMTGNGQTGTGNDLDNRMVGSSGDDHIYGLAGSDLLQGGDGNDYLDGGIGNDTLRGDAGNDTILGGDGNDTILGGDGSDTILGGNGNDLIEGGTGNDIMTGGAGMDTFRFRTDDLTGRQSDTITDFVHGQDVISLSLADANINTAVNDAFKFIGTQSFHHLAGELRYEVVGGTAHVYGDLNGDGVADFSIALTGVSSLSAGDFVL